MNKELRLDILSQLKELIKTPGYIYALCMILIEDNSVITEEINEANYRDRLNVKEQALLLGFLIQNGIDFTQPDSPLTLIDLKDKTYELMKELHLIIFQPNVERMKRLIQEKPSEEEKGKMSDFYKGDDLFVEQIFYSDNGAYDFQFLDFRPKRYANDTDWLLKNRNFKSENATEIVKKIQEITEIKAKKINFLSLKERLPDYEKEAKKIIPKKDFDKQFKIHTSRFEFLQYLNLLSKDIENIDNLTDENFYENGWDNFYTGIIDLFVVNKNEFNETLDIDSFFENFAIGCNGGVNKQFSNIGEFNEFNSLPILKLDEKRYFVPTIFQLYEALFENPFYWILEDDDYLSNLGKNRGNSGELITYELLEKVFGKENIFHSIDIESKKGTRDSEIDVLCVFGNKALCVQVKSKKLTLASKQGNSKQLEKDFKAAVQDAYDQGLICRNKILENKAKFYTAGRKEWKLPEGIEEVYILEITTENYPSLNHQSNIFLNKKTNDPNAIFMSIFDLEVVTHYLNEPYEFLYYIKQRIELVDYFKAENEIGYLGYHLQYKLAPDEESTYIIIDNIFAQNVDRNYYPKRMGFHISNKNDSLKQRWKNVEFDKLCAEIANYNFPQKTDVIFSLFDRESDTRDSIIKHLKNCKLETKKNNSNHDRTILSEDCFGNKSGTTCFSQNNNDSDDLLSRLSNYCRAKKYNCKADSWIGIGSLLFSNNITDLVVYLAEPWKYDREEEEFANKILPQQPTKTKKVNRKKIGRNEQCSCGSGKKYKKCCGQ